MFLVYSYYMEKIMQKAADHLAKHDQILAPVIKRAGLCTIRPVKSEDYYWELVDAIISQQLSVKAARAIEERFKALYPGALPTPDQILVTPDEKLRSVGLSGAKVKYVKSLAEHIRDGKLELERFSKPAPHQIPSGAVGNRIEGHRDFGVGLSNLQVSRELTKVSGIGEWTAHMFLMFAMARLDVLAVGDLGIKQGIQKLYNLPSLPSPEKITKLALANNWHPYESVACWYIWHAKDST
jgi:DNA-3-methyladenine glycosylase II